MLKIDRTGEFHISNEGYEMEIIKSDGSLNCTIRFTDNGHIISGLSYHQIKNGQVKNPYHKSIYGVGYHGVGNYIAHIKRKPTKCYDCWLGIIRRCYSEKSFIRRPTYRFVKVHEDWHCFQNFAHWYHKNFVENWELDKDILSGESKIYSVTTCAFVPTELNNIFKSNVVKDKSKTILDLINRFKENLNPLLYNKLNKEYE